MNVVNSCAAYFQYLFKKAIKVFAVTFDQFNVSLIKVFISSLTDPTFLNIAVILLCNVNPSKKEINYKTICWLCNVLPYKL